MVRVGVIGVGTIAKAVLTGLCTAFKNNEKPDFIEGKILISKRGTANANELATNFPEFIEIASDLETIVNNSDWLIVALLPTSAAEILNGFTFRKDQIVLNFMSGILSEEDAKKVFAPVEQVVRVCPWPCARLRLGPIMILNSPNELVTQFLGLVGTVTHTTTMDEFITICASSCVMASFYNSLETITKWLEGKNIPKATASTFLGSIIHAFAVDAKNQGDQGFQHITDDSQTPGGLNEQVLKSLVNDGVFNHLTNALDAVVERQKKK